MMLNWNASRYQDEMALARQANLNFLRIWGPTGVPPEALFDAADREGILLQQDFLNDWWGTEHNAPGNAPPSNLVEEATTAIIKKCRNHPSLVLWCGGNEGPNPNEDMIKNRLLPALDPWGSRFYLAGSNREGVQGGGPYDNLSPEKYFNNRKLTGFNSEVGPSGVPEWESLQQFLTLPPTNWAEGRFPLDGQWAYHDATDRPGASESRKFSHLDNVLRHRFGEPATTDLAGVRGYSARTQMLNFDTYRAAVEALNKNLWTKTTGFALWKFNSSWPSVVWQVTDWYLQCHAGFYAVRRACEPIHVQFNSDDRTVSVVNRTDESPADLNLRAELFDYSMKSLWLHQETVSTKPQTAMAGSWTVPEEPGITFLKLRLNDAAGRAVSDNLYWLNETNNFAPLAQLDGARVDAKVSFPGKGGAGVRVKLTNRGSAPALLVRVQLVDRESQVEILPTLWSDNYVSLLPGESVELTGRTMTGDFPGHPALVVSGFNLAPAVY
jgi:exo-1,4-beta-D-glucosaminidase